ncbi:MAG: cytochrome c [Polyangiaceae bacterium]
MSPRPGLEGRAPRCLAACLLLAACAVALLWASPARAEKGARDIVVRLAGALLDQAEKRVVVRLDMTLPLHEWEDQRGELHIEPQPGTGKAWIELPSGGQEEVRFSARLLRFLGPPEILPDGRRAWSLRGELYLMADGREVLDTEIGPAFIVPPAGEKSTYPLPETWPGGDDMAQEIGRSVETWITERRGGFFTTGPVFWDRPRSQLPHTGLIAVVEVESKPASKGSAGRDADRLVNRIQYVASDYARSVKDGKVVNQLEYTEQLRLLQEAEVLADGLGVTDRARSLLGDLRRRVTWAMPASEVALLCEELQAELLSTTGMLLASPVPSDMASAAPLFREHCAKCHGASGDGRGPSAKELDPPPRSFTDPAETAGMSPHRAFMAISSGVPGTAMASFEDALSLEERWTLAFHVLSLRHEGSSLSASHSPVSFSLDELATTTDQRLFAAAEQAGAGARSAEVVAYWRSAAAVDAARESPFEPVRRELCAAVSGEAEDAPEALDRAEEALLSVVPEVRLRDETAAEEAAKALSSVRAALAEGSGEAEVRRAAWRAFPALRKAELALALPPRRDGGSKTIWGGFAGVLLFALAGMAWWIHRGRAVQTGHESVSGSPS